MMKIIASAVATVALMVGTVSAETQFVFRYKAGLLPVSGEMETPPPGEGKEEPSGPLSHSASIELIDSNGNGIGDLGEIVTVSGSVTNHTAAAVDLWIATALVHGGYKTMSCDDWQIQPGASVSCELSSPINKAFYETYGASPGQLLAFGAWIEFDTSEGVERIDAGQVAFEVPEFPEPTEQPSASAVSFSPSTSSYTDSDGDNTMSPGDIVTTRIYISNYNGDETFPIESFDFQSDWGGYFSTAYQCGPVSQGQTSILCNGAHTLTQDDICGIPANYDGYLMTIKPIIHLDAMTTSQGTIPVGSFAVGNRSLTLKKVDLSDC